MRARRWPTLNEMRDTYAASGLELAKRHPACRGKIRYAQAIDADRHRVELMGSPDEHAARARRLDVYACRWCQGHHVGHRPQAPGRRGKRRQRMQH